MQTYLLAFIVSDYTYVAVHGKIPQRVFAPTHLIEAGHADFAVRAGYDILTYLDQYVNMDYSKYLSKLDQAYIPDFSAGAMENWGLVTYRDTAILVTKTDTWASRHSVASTIAHEYV